MGWELGLYSKFHFYLVDILTRKQGNVGDYNVIFHLFVKDWNLEIGVLCFGFHGSSHHEILHDLIVVLFLYLVVCINLLSVVDVDVFRAKRFIGTDNLDDEAELGRGWTVVDGKSSTTTADAQRHTHPFDGALLEESIHGSEVSHAVLRWLTRCQLTTPFQPRRSS